MLTVMLLAAAAGQGGGGAEEAYRAWRGCIGETTRVAAQEGRLPEEMAALLRAACPDERGNYLRAVARQMGAAAEGNTPPAAQVQVNARGEALVGSYVRRYAVFYTTGLWPER